MKATIKKGKVTLENPLGKLIYSLNDKDFLISITSSSKESAFSIDSSGEYEVAGFFLKVLADTEKRAVFVKSGEFSVGILKGTVSENVESILKNTTATFILLDKDQTAQKAYTKALKLSTKLFSPISSDEKELAKVKKIAAGDVVEVSTAYTFKRKDQEIEGMSVLIWK